MFDGKHIDSAAAQSGHDDLATSGPHGERAEGERREAAQAVVNQLVTMHADYRARLEAARVFRLQAEEFEDLPRNVQNYLKRIGRELEQLPRSAAHALRTAYQSGLPIDYPQRLTDYMRGQEE